MNSVEAFRRKWRTRPHKALISVHRGLWGPAPENSCAAIAAAAPFGIIEIDVQMARDAVPVVIHDPDLQRTAGKALIPQDVDSTELIAHRLLVGAGGQDAGWSDQCLPTLTQAIEAAGPNAYFDFDVKYPGEVAAVGQFLSDANLTRFGSLKIDIATTGDIDQLLDLQNRFGIMVMAKVVLPDAGLEHIQMLKDAGVAAAEVWFDDLDQLGEACAIAGDQMAISTFTLDPVHCCGLSDAKAEEDPDAVWGRLLDAGVTILMTDKAERLEQYLREIA